MERVKNLHGFFKSLGFHGEHDRATGIREPTRFSTEFSLNDDGELDANITLKIDRHHHGGVRLDRELFPENYDESRKTTMRTDADNARRLAEKIRELGIHDTEIHSINMQEMPDWRYAYGKQFTTRGLTGSNKTEQKAVSELTEKLARYKELDETLKESLQKAAGMQTRWKQK